MTPKANANSKVEVASDQLKAELIEIKERVGALETIASISNKDVVEGYVRGALTSNRAKQIMSECEQPRTKEDLVAKFEFASTQALDYYLTPLRESDLIRHQFDADGTQRFEWSNLFRRLPKRTIKDVLKESKGE